MGSEIVPRALPAVNRNADGETVTTIPSDTIWVAGGLTVKPVPDTGALDGPSVGAGEATGLPAVAVVAADVADSAVVALSVTFSSHEYVLVLTSPVAEHVSVAPPAAPLPLFVVQNDEVTNPPPLTETSQVQE